MSRRRRYVRIAAALLALSAVLYVLASVWVSHRLTQGYRRPVHPTPRELGLTFSSAEIVTEDHIPLACWIVEPVDRPRATVLLFHGIRGARHTRWMQFVAQRRCRAVAIDLRGHGESGEAPVSFGWNERHDVDATIDFAKRRWPKSKLVAWGMSMGGAAVAFSSHSPQLDGVVLSGVYRSLESALQVRLDRSVPRWLHPFALGPLLVTQWRFGVAIRAICPQVTVPRLDRCQVLLAGGADDDRAGPEHLEALAKALPRAATCLVPGAGHELLFGYPTFAKAFDRLLEQATGG